MSKFRKVNYNTAGSTRLLEERIKELQDKIHSLQQKLKETKDDQKWFEFSSKINGLTVDLDVSRKQYRYRNSHPEYVPDLIEILKNQM